MKNISNIITERGYNQKAFNHIVAEWEDELATDSHAGLVYERPICRNPKIRFLGGSVPNCSPRKDYQLNLR